MAHRYEWQERRGGRRYVRIPGDAPVKTGGKVVVPPEAVAEAEAVPEVKIEAAEGQVVAAPKRGRPKKADAPVVIKDDADE